MPSKAAVQSAINPFNAGATPQTASNAKQKFQTCLICWKPTPVGEPACVNCGQRTLRATAAGAQELFTRHFLLAFFERATPVTYGIILLNLGLYLMMTVSTEGRWFDDLLRGVDEATLLAFGAKTNGVLRLGDWFRFITPIFLHLSGLHLLSNSFALAIVGPQVERLYGSARFLLIYLLAGFGGLAASTLNHALTDKQIGVAVGASGAIFGLFGVLAVFSLKYRKSLPESFINPFALAVLPAIAINLFVGFTVPFIDNSAHVGGLLAGVLLAFIIPYLGPGRERSSWPHLALAAACVLLVAYCFSRAYAVSPLHDLAAESVQNTTLSNAPDFKR